MSNIALNDILSQVIIKELTPLQIEILDVLIYYANRYKKVFLSQTLISKLLGCNRSTVNRYLKKLNIIKIISKQTRFNRISRVHDTCVYKLSDVFITHAHKLRHLFKSLKYTWNISDLLSWLPSKKAIIENNFKEMSHLVLGITYNKKKRSRSADINLENKMARLEIPSILKKITEKMSLTCWGQIELLFFPEEALESAWLKITKDTSFNTLFLNAMNYCKEHNIEPDWKMLSDLKKKYKVPSNARFVSKGATPPSTFTVKKPEIKPIVKKKLRGTPEWEEEIRDKYVPEKAERIINNVNSFSKFPAPGSKE